MQKNMQKNIRMKNMLKGVKNLMKSTSVSLEQAIKMLGLKGTTKKYILSQLQK